MTSVTDGYFCPHRINLTWNIMLFSLTTIDHMILKLQMCSLVLGYGKFGVQCKGNSKCTQCFSTQENWSEELYQNNHFSISLWMYLPPWNYYAEIKLTIFEKKKILFLNGVSSWGTYKKQGIFVWWCLWLDKLYR